jgi:hypothetical protein
MMRGISLFLHQAKNSKNTGSSHNISVEGGFDKDTLNEVINFLHTNLAEVSLYIHRTCPLATTLANTFLNPFLQGNTSVRPCNLNESKTPGSYPTRRVYRPGEDVGIDHMERI